MRLAQRRVREVYRVYGEGEVPDHEEWSQSTREHGEGEQPTRTLHRVVVMTLLGAGVGLVAALALHSVGGFMAGKGGGAGRAGPRGVALLAKSAPRGAVASVPPSAPAQPAITAVGPGRGAAHGVRGHRQPAREGNPDRRRRIPAPVGGDEARRVATRSSAQPAQSGPVGRQTVGARQTVAEQSGSAATEASSLAAAQVAERPAPAAHTSEFGFEG